MTQHSTDDSLPPPSAYGLPAHYAAWRPHQARAVSEVLGAERPNVALVAPTGFGKSIAAETIALFNGGRSVYHVVTKPLQDQISRDFSHRYDVRGKSNYDCQLLLDNGVYGARAKCDQAEALCEICQYKDRGCHYFDRVRGAKNAEHVIDNYAFWLACARYNSGAIGAFTTLICDEAHQAVDQLSKALRIELSPMSVERFTGRPLPAPQPNGKWREWALAHLIVLRPKLDALQANARLNGANRSTEMKELKPLVSALEGLAGLQGDWIEDRSGMGVPREEYRRIGFEPIWPAPYSGLLFQSAPHRLLMSATIRPKTLELLGLKSEEFKFLEYPSSFPVAHRPVVHVKTVQQRASMSEQQKIEAVRRIDQIIDGRKDRKGIIHTVSFERARYLLEHSRHAQLMIWNEPRSKESTQSVVQRFKRSPAPAILVSPSVDTGYDFPYQQCEYQIIMKVPFLDRRNPIAGARCKSDENYDSYNAMQSIVQMAGRGMRAADDRCEVLIVDDQFLWFYGKCLKLGFVPAWFAPAVRLGCTIPRAPERLTMHNSYNDEEVLDAE